MTGIPPATNIRVMTQLAPGQRLALQAVGRRTEIAELDGWGDVVPRTRIVAIGSPIDAGELTHKFDTCLAESGRG